MLATLKMRGWGGDGKREDVTDCYIAVIVIIGIIFDAVLYILKACPCMLLYCAPGLLVIEVILECK